MPSQVPRLELVVPDPDVVKAEIAENGFRAFNHLEFLRRDRLAKRNTGTQAGHLRLVGRGQTQPAENSRISALVRPISFKRGANLEFRGGLGSWPKVSHVARVLAVSQNGKSSALASGASSVKSSALQK